mgnify:CR=1 FL=1
MTIDLKKLINPVETKKREIKRNEPKTDWQNGINDYTDEDILDVLYHIRMARMNDEYTRDEVYKVIEQFATNSVPAIPIHKVVAGWERVVNELQFEEKEELEERVKGGLKDDERQEQKYEFVYVASGIEMLREEGIITQKETIALFEQLLDNTKNLELTEDDIEFYRNDYKF